MMDLLSFNCYVSLLDTVIKKECETDLDRGGAKGNGAQEEERREGRETDTQKKVYERCKKQMDSVDEKKQGSRVHI